MSKMVPYVMKTIPFKIESNLLKIVSRSKDVERFSRLLSLRGFDYRNGGMFLNLIKIDTSEYFDVDIFMEIIDILGYKTFNNIALNSDNYDHGNKEEFREHLLANIV